MQKALYAQCDQCPLKDQPFVPPKFRGIPQCIILGEAPGRQEALKGEPFVGDAGQLLSATMVAAGLDPQATFVTNTVLCHPPRNQYASAAASACFPRLEHELRKVRAKYPVPIVALGLEAATTLVDDPHRNSWQLTKEYGPVLPLYHPAYVLRKPQFAIELLAGLRKLHYPIPTTTEATTQTRVLEHCTDVIKWVRAMCERGGKIAWDLETDQINWRKDKVLCFGASWAEGKAIVIPQRTLADANVLAGLRQLFAAYNIEFIAHNGKFDVKFMKKWFMVDARCDFDTMLAHFALDERTGGGEIHALKTLVALEFDVPDYEQQLVQRYLKSRNDRYSKVPAKHLHTYCGIDCDYTRRLAIRFGERLKAEGLYDNPFLMPLMAATHPIMAMEMNGVPCDEAELTRLELHLIAERDDVKTHMVKVVGHDFNPRSWQQKGVILYDEMGAKEVTGRDIKPRSTGKPARAKLKGIYGPHTKVDEFLPFEVIDKLSGNIAKFLALLDRYSKVEKLRGSYATNILKLIQDGRVYPTFKLHGAETGRISATGPAIQTIPRSSEVYGAMIKRTYKATEGWAIVSVDYSQAELRVAAALSGEPFLIKVYAEDRDLHDEVAIAMFGPNFTKEQRAYCKMFNFSYLYGGTEYSFANDAGLPIATAKAFVQQYNTTMPILKEWKDDQAALMLSQGYVETPFGRRRRFPLVLRQNADEARKASFNMPIQGTASDLTLMSAAAIHAWMCANPALRKVARMIITVHDSIIFEVRQERAKAFSLQAKRTMEEVAAEMFPQVAWKADVEIGPSWGELKSQGG